MSGGEQTAPIDILIVGHVTRDDLPDGTWQLGGATYATLAAVRQGWRVGLVTSGPEELIARARETLPGVVLVAVPASEATTFVNTYDAAGIRTQHLRARAANLSLAAIPAAWHGAPVALLAPFAQEVAPAIARALSSPLIGVTPQGWLRRWRADGLVLPCPPERIIAVLSAIHALILSCEDLLPDSSLSPANGAGLPTDVAEVEALLATWAERGPLIAETRGAGGARLHARNQPSRDFPAYPATEVDPTGAGDVFAVSFLLALHETRDPAAAMDFANRAAALRTERAGLDGVPTREEVTARWGI